MNPQLLSFDDHDKRSAELPSPYVYMISKLGQTLTYFGGSHSHDPKRQQFEILQNEWSIFLNETKHCPRVVLVEGGLPPVYDSIEMAIEESSEPGALTYLASKEAIETISPEPADQELYKAISNKVGGDAYMFYWAANTLCQWFRTRQEGELREYLERAFVFLSDLDPAGYGKFTWEQFIELSGKYGAPGFERESKDWWDSIVNPVLTGHSINKVARIVNTYRDEFIVRRIQGEWDQGKSIFIAYGRSHAFMQEPYLRSVLQ